MSLDQNLFTLFFTSNPSYPAGTVVDLTDGSGTIHYRKRRIVPQQQQQQAAVYRMEVSDPLSEALLASATSPSPTSKHKTLELYNPSHVVELKYTGTLTFRWSFTWETHEFEWKREECFIIRKPDPPVLVALTKEPPGRIRTTSVQILDYNLHRFDINDRKGLEIVILMALLTFRDASDAYHEPNPPATDTPPTSTSTPVSHIPSAAAAPTLPPRPARKKGIERIAELQLGRGQVNEVTVLEEGAISDYAKHGARLLQDDAMLFISVRSSDSKQVPKVLRVVDEIKRVRYKAGDPDVHQYVLYDAKAGVTPHQGPRIINLDDTQGKGKNRAYTPPKSLTVHLSKIDMPELGPRRTPLDRQHTTRREGESGKKKEKEQSKRVREKERAKGRDKDKVRDGRSKPTSRSEAPPHPTVLHKHRSQYLYPTPSGSSSPFPSSSHGAPSLPSRAQHAPGLLRRQSMYGSLDADHYYYDHEGRANMASPTNNISSTSGSLGRFLRR